MSELVDKKKARDYLAAKLFIAEIEHKTTISMPTQVAWQIKQVLEE